MQVSWQCKGKNTARSHLHIDTTLSISSRTSEPLQQEQKMQKRPIRTTTDALCRYTRAEREKARERERESKAICATTSSYVKRSTIQYYYICETATNETEPKSRKERKRNEKNVLLHSILEIGWRSAPYTSVCAPRIGMDIW